MLEMHYSMVDILPKELVSDIISRLPIDSILQCRQVCKSWRALLRRHRALLQLHGNSSPGYIFQFSLKHEKGRQLYYGEYNQHLPNKKLQRINQPTTNHAVVGSFNGLICFATDRNHVHEPSYIGNPITGEYVNLPELDILSPSTILYMVCGYGYLSSVDKYKVIRIFNFVKEPQIAHVQLYTLGSTGWKDVGVGVIHHSILQRFTPYGTFANGALHWLNNHLDIVSFDMAEEKFYVLPSPPLIHEISPLDGFQLRVLGGCLCFVHHREYEFLDMWFLRKKDASSGCDVNEQEYDLLKWTNEFSISIEGRIEPFTLTSNGEVLLLDHERSLYCYESKTQTLERLMISEDVRVTRAIVPHVKSFVSLRYLGERSRLRKRKRYNANPSNKVVAIQKEENAG